MKRTARGMGMVLASLIGVAALASPARAAGQPPVDVVEVAPREGGAVLVERTAAGLQGSGNHWRLHLDIWLDNQSDDELMLTTVKVMYTGGSDPDNLTAIVNRPVPAAGLTKLIVPESRQLPYPLPEEVWFHLKFSGYPIPVIMSFPLVEYENKGSGGSYLYPGRSADLPEGQWWSTPKGDKLTSHHRKSRTQRFAYDMAVVRPLQNGTWTGLKPGTDGSSNGDHLGFGRPIYAIGDGEIMRCWTSFADNVPGETIGGAGNSFWIRHGAGEYTLYAHLKHGSIPGNLCPDNGQGSGIHVSAGQFLGRMGNSGHSSKPHIHIHTQRYHKDFSHPAAPEPDGRPLLFDGIKVRDRDEFDPADPIAGFQAVNEGAALDLPQLVLTPDYETNGLGAGGGFGYDKPGPDDPGWTPDPDDQPSAEPDADDVDEPAGIEPEADAVDTQSTDTGDAATIRAGGRAGDASASSSSSSANGVASPGADHDTNKLRIAIALIVLLVVAAAVVTRRTLLR